MEFWEKDIRKLLKDFLFYIMIWLVFNYLYQLIVNQESIELMEYIIYSICAIIIGNGNLLNVSFGAIWYIPMLISIKVIYRLLDNIMQGNIVRKIIVCVLIFFLGSIKLNGISSLPWYFSNTFTAILFFGLGDISRKWCFKLDNFKTRRISLLFIVTLTEILLAVPYAGTVNLGRNTYDNVIMLVTNACCGIVMILCAGVLVERIFRGYGQLAVDRLKYYGINSLHIMGWHSEIRIIITALLTGYISNSLIKSFIILVCTLILVIPLTKYSNYVLK